LAESTSGVDADDKPWRIVDKLSDRFERIRDYIDVTGAHKILRRYFVMNAFDGAMTSLGIVIGAYVSHITNPRAIIGVILVGGMAMVVSGFAGTYMTESAERTRSLNELEDAMLMSLEDTVHGDASRFVPLLAALVDGSAPFIASLPSILPFGLSLVGLLSINAAVLSSTAASLATLFVLGVFLGKVSGSNIVYSGVKMVVAGALVALIALLLDAA